MERIPKPKENIIIHQKWKGTALLLTVKSLWRGKTTVSNRGKDLIHKFLIWNPGGRVIDLRKKIENRIWHGNPVSKFYIICW
jgi:hypothetical protein